MSATSEVEVTNVEEGPRCRPPEEGSKRCPGVFKQRLKAAFPRETVVVVWNDVSESWAVSRYDSEFKRYQFIMEEPGDLDEGVIVRLRAGYLGSVAIPDAQEYVDDTIRTEDERKEKRYQDWKARYKAKLKAGRYWLKASITGEYPLNDRYLVATKPWEDKKDADE